MDDKRHINLQLSNNDMRSITVAYGLHGKDKEGKREFYTRALLAGCEALGKNQEKKAVKK